MQAFSWPDIGKPESHIPETGIGVFAPQYGPKEAFSAESLDIFE
jgi:hypothetical protein